MSNCIVYLINYKWKINSIKFIYIIVFKEFLADVKLWLSNGKKPTRKKNKGKNVDVLKHGIQKILHGKTKLASFFSQKFENPLRKSKKIN